MIDDPYRMPELNAIGPYRIMRRLGAGGAAGVFEVEFRGGDARTYALKPLCVSDDENSLERQERFKREMLIGLSIRHDNVCRMVDWGFHEDLPYLVMELLKGSTLEDHIALHGPLSADETRGLLVQTLRGLEVIHEAGVIHRNLAPRNVFLTQEGVVKIMDFSMASKSGLASITETGTALGTPMFLSPEQLRDTKRVSHLTDLFSVGVLTWLMLTRHHPFAGRSLPEVVKNVLQAPTPSLVEARPDLPASLDGWLVRVLAKAPEARFQSAREALESLPL